MYHKVKIKKLPNKAVGGGINGNRIVNNQLLSWGGADFNMAPKKPKITDTISGVPRDKANLEAEGGETVYGDVNGDGMAEHLTIKGPRHSSGGVPLNLPDGTFIFSDTKSMRIKDPKILANFGKTKGSYTPAELAKQYNISKYRKILQDPDSDNIERKTAEIMIRNYNMKLGALAIVQESKKGFPQGLPEVAKPYMEAHKIEEQQLMPQQPQQQGMSEEQDMPTAQNGIILGPLNSPALQSPDQDVREKHLKKIFNQAPNIYYDRNQPGMMDYIKTRNKYNMLKNREEFFPEVGPPSEQQMHNYENTLFELYDPAYKSDKSPEEKLKDYQKSYEECPCMKTMYVQGKPKKVCVECGEDNKAQYGYEMPFYSGDTMPMYDEYAYGGSLDRYEEKGEVKQTPKRKNYSKDQLPAGANIKKPGQVDIKPGDFVMQPDGTYLKVTKASFKASASDTKTRQGTAKDWAEASPENKKIMDQANDIIEREIKNKRIINKNGNITIPGDLNLPMNERLIISQAFNSNPNLATDKYKVSLQNSNPKFRSYITEGGKQKLAPGSFVSGFTPQDYEDRYIYEKAKGSGASHEDALAEVNRIKQDPAAKAQLRKEFAEFVGIDTKDISDADLTNDNFYDSRYAQVTKGIENALGAEDYRTRYGNDLKSGFEHYDAYGIASDFGYEDEPTEEPGDCPCEDGTTKKRNPDGSCPPCDQPDEGGGEEEETPPPPGSNPEWWLQDKLKVAGAMGDLGSIKKYMPWAPRADLKAPSPVYLDPTRELAAQSENANLMAQGLGQFAGPQAFAANMSGMQGNAATNAANTLSKYNNANVNLANQFAWKQADVSNQEQLMNQATQQRLYDQTTVANQQFDNAKRAARNNLLNQYISGVTNMNKTDALNQMYPNYKVNAPSGGRMDYVPTNNKITPSQQQNIAKRVLELKKSGLQDEVAFKTAQLEAGAGGSEGANMDAYNQQYGNKKKGGTQFAYVMGSNVFPPFFY